MSCIAPDPALQRVLDGCAHEPVPVADVTAEVLAQLVGYGWVYEWQGRVELTGAYHATTARRAGMLE